MATELKVGQTLPLSIAFFDQNGNPMDGAPTPDSSPAWANIFSPADTLTAAPDGMSAKVLAMAAGDDTVRLQLSVGGVQYSATLDLLISGGVSQQTLASIGIVAGTPTP